MDDLPVVEFALPGPLREKLVAGIVAGDKTTTSSLYEEWRRDREPLPPVGRREVVVDSAGVGICITETVRISTCRLADITLSHAVGEGEGFTNVAAWRSAHEGFWNSAEFRASVGEPQLRIDDDTLIVCEEFRLVSLLSP
ncbi:MAG TPA: ASCH domain-containing protein [Dietzia timorensis]|uniref:ASCH domain-containing protein n=1 Tax=Dietzia timorensis TaxID=499555 RepID=A0A921JXC2_9ACTN|nr:ASCH domain-containing protein [Dietzia timorensis]HJE89673.1 ASCH domain-containing protein [Dietzia timorensis]